MLKTSLDKSIKYTFDDLKNFVIKSYRNSSPYIKYSFNQAETIEIGSNTKIYHNFIDKDGKILNFWDVCESFKDNQRRINIYIYTTASDKSLIPSISVVSEISEQLAPIAKEFEENCFTNTDSLPSFKYELPYDNRSNHQMNDSVNSMDNKNSLDKEKSALNQSEDKNKKNYAHNFKAEKFKSNNKDGSMKDIINFLENSETPESSLRYTEVKNYCQGNDVDLKKNCETSKPKRNIEIYQSQNSDHENMNNKISKMKEDYFKEPELKKPKINQNNNETKEVPGNSMLKKLKLLNLKISTIEERKIKFTSEILGVGGQGIVIKAKYLRTPVAVKSIELGKHDVELYREIDLMQRIRHQNIISIMAVCPLDTKCHIVMELFDGKSLSSTIFNKDMIEKYEINLQKKSYIIHQICTGLAFLHLQDNPIIHRDLKPANILINKECKIKICDLGLSSCNQMATMLMSSYGAGVTIKGTLFYLPPEIILWNKRALLSSDIWALGCTIFEIYNETNCWNPPKEVYDAHYYLRDQYRKQVVPNLKNIPSFFRETVLGCFEYVSEKRLNIENILDVLENNCKFD